MRFLFFFFTYLPLSLRKKTEIKDRKMRKSSVAVARNRRRRRIVDRLLSTAFFRACQSIPRCCPLFFLLLFHETGQDRETEGVSRPSVRPGRFCVFPTSSVV